MSLEAGTESDRLWRNAAYQLAFSGFLSYLSHQPKGGTAHSGLGLLTSASNKMHHNMPAGQSHLGNSSAFPSS